MGQYSHGLISSRRKKQLLIAMLLQTIPLTHIMEKTPNGDDFTDLFHTANFYPPYL
jgi:hypothetical protein